METFVFRALVKLLREKQLLSDGLLKVEEQVAMFLDTRAKNMGNRSVQERFHHSSNIVSRHFHNVLNAINQLSELIITPPLRTSQFIVSCREFYPFFMVCSRRGYAEEREEENMWYCAEGKRGERQTLFGRNLDLSIWSVNLLCGRLAAPVAVPSLPFNEISPLRSGAHP